MSTTLTGGLGRVTKRFYLMGTLVGALTISSGVTATVTGSADYDNVTVTGTTGTAIVFSYRNASIVDWIVTSTRELAPFDAPKERAQYRAPPAPMRERIARALQVLRAPVKMSGHFIMARSA